MAKKYEVGFGKPPKSSQWKPGQSGNPKGARSAKQNIALLESLAQQLNMSVPIQIAGKSKTVQMGEALAMTIVRDLMAAPVDVKLAGLVKLARLGVLDLQAQSLAANGIVRRIAPGSDGAGRAVGQG
ncbi:MAG: DUF5681 domain-containing protein, partial [Novosphingobium sp.]